jgi:hypothetical protein
LGCLPSTSSPEANAISTYFCNFEHCSVSKIQFIILRFSQPFENGFICYQLGLCRYGSGRYSYEKMNENPRFDAHRR